MNGQIEILCWQTFAGPKNVYCFIHISKLWALEMVFSIGTMPVLFGGRKVGIMEQLCAGVNRSQSVSI